MITNKVEVLDINDIDRNKDVADYLATSICNRTVLYGRNEYRRTAENICVPTSPVEALHEIARWMCCDEESKNEVRLDLYYNFTRIADTNNIPDVKAKYEEESVALCLTKLLFDNFMIEPNRREQQYVEYLFEQHRWIAQTFDKQDSIEEAQNIYNKYIAGI